MSWMTGCRHFNGYKPCGKSEICDSLCPHYDRPQLRILMIHLEALGAVLRATSVLPAIKRKYPSSHITWVTQKPAQLLLQNNPYVDRILTIDSQDLLALSALEFDIGFVADKSQVAAGVLKHTHVDILYGFKVDASTGAIMPATSAAQELWALGLSNQKKFFENQKPETQLTAEAFELEFKRDPYILQLTSIEEAHTLEKKLDWSHSGKKVVVGINTGCANVIPYKKLSIENHRELIKKLKEIPNVQIVLLGGKEDTDNNLKISEGFDIILSPTENGMRDGLTSVAACDLVITGDSLGMHMAIALKKYVIAWFGPTCEQEIDLYDRGQKVLSQASCTPCWKRTCNKNPMCYDLVNLDQIVLAVQKGIEWQTSSCKPHFSAMHSSQYR